MISFAYKLTTCASILIYTILHRPKCIRRKIFLEINAAPITSFILNTYCDQILLISCCFSDMLIFTKNTHYASVSTHNSFLILSISDSFLSRFARSIHKCISTPDKHVIWKWCLWVCIFKNRVWRQILKRYQINF